MNSIEKNLLANTPSIKETKEEAINLENTEKNQTIEDTRKENNSDTNINFIMCYYVFNYIF